jgi:hypothetical protein
MRGSTGSAASSAATTALPESGSAVPCVQALQVRMAKRRVRARRREERGRVDIAGEAKSMRGTDGGRRDFVGRRYLFRTFLSD